MFHLFSLFFFPKANECFSTAEHQPVEPSAVVFSEWERASLRFSFMEYEGRFWVWASVFGVMKLADSFSYWSRITCLFFFFSPHVRYTLLQPCRPISPSIWIVMEYLIGKLQTTTLNFNKDEFVQSFSLF